MKYIITHTTSYSYSESASLSQNEVFLSPRDLPFQKLMKNSLNISPEPQYIKGHTDYFGNLSYVFMVQQSHMELKLTARSEVETFAFTMVPPENTLSFESVVQRLLNCKTFDEIRAYQFVFPSPFINIPPGIKEYALKSFPSGTPVLKGAVDLMNRIYSDFTYDKNATTVDTTIEQLINDKKGVCQDYAHFTISCLRSLGLSAKYVSGYLETMPPPGKPKLIGSDASHAWLSIYVPDVGWVDLDPTNNLVTGEKHITLAYGRDYGDVIPVKGVVLGGGVHNLSVMVDVAALSL